MKKAISNLPGGVKQAACGLCLGTDKKRVWAVQCTAFTGFVCDAHMELLVRQQNGQPAEDAPTPTLFDGRTG